jgi:positive regulator of sigma E activity
MHQRKGQVWLEFQRTSRCGAGCPAAAACCRSSAAKASPLGTLRQAKMTAGRAGKGGPGFKLSEGGWPYLAPPVA